MAFEFDLDTLNDNLDPFGLSCPERDSFIEKMEMLCKTYRKTTDDISDEIVSVMNNAKKQTVDSNILIILEENLESQAQKLAQTPRSNKKPVRVPLAEKSGFILSGDDEKDNRKPLTTSVMAKLEGHFLDFSPFPNSPANVKFLKRGEAHQVINTIRGRKFQDIGIKPVAVTKTEEKLKIISKLPNNLYGGDKSSVVIEAKSRRMSEFAQRLQEIHEEIVDWGNPLMASVDMVYTYGQIVHDDTKDNEKFGEHSVALMINDENGSMVRLDVSKISEVTLFPGQIVAVRGTNETGEELVVDKIFSSPPLPMAFIETDTSKEIWFACGPYTAADNCGYEQLCELLDKVVLEKPDILILAGPFVDKKNSYLSKTAFTMTHDDLLEDVIMKIKYKLLNTKTEVIIQPSACRDICIPSVYPSPAFDLNHKKLDSIRKEILFVPDPCVLRIGPQGLEIAVTSSEPVQALGNTELHRSANQENCDRLVRLSSHLLTQQSLFPVEPIEMPASMADVLSVCRIAEHTPHIVFAPSRLAPYVKDVYSSVFVNSSTLAKGPTGNYLRMTVNLHANELGSGETVADYSNVQILKI